MAKLDRLPEKYIIDGFKGTADYYYWKGIPVARKWPVARPRTPGPIEAQNRADFAYINKLYATLPDIIITALQDHATGTTQVAKDYLVRAYLKELFAMAPPDYFATEETQLQVLAELLQKLETGDLHLDPATKDLWVKVSQSALPAGAATQTTLAAILTRLNAIKITTSARWGVDDTRTNLAPGAQWLVYTVNQSGVIDGCAISSNSNLCRWYDYTDFIQHREPIPGGAGVPQPRMDRLNAIGGRGAWWELVQYDPAIPSFVARLQTPIRFFSNRQFYIWNDDVVPINVSIIIAGQVLS